MMSGPYERIMPSNATVSRSTKYEEFDILDFPFPLVSWLSSINSITKTFSDVLPIVYHTNKNCYA